MQKGKEKELRNKRKNSNRPKSPLDINQIELAFINRIIDGEIEEIPQDLEISSIPRIQKIQKRNLENLCKKLKKEYDKNLLEKELVLLLNGEKSLPIGAFGPSYRIKS